MSKHLPHNVWRLVHDCNTRRGEILDGKRTSETDGAPWSKGKKHAVDDDSAHYAIQKYLETRDGKQATVRDILDARLHSDIRSREYLSDYLRELEKQGICEQVS